jgi:hypothetical protein
VENGKWKMENGKWKMENGLWVADGPTIYSREKSSNQL